MEWETLVYRAISNGLIKPGNLESLMVNGPDFEDAPDEIVAESNADDEYTIGYHNNRPCLYDEARGCGYYVPSGFTYEQKYSGSAWQTITRTAGQAGENALLLP